MSKFDTVDFVYETKVNTKITENSHTDEKELEQNDDCTERYDKNEINSKDTLVKILERKQNSVINDANENLEKEIETNNQTQNDLENEETKLHYQQTTANDAVPAHKSKSTQLKNLEEISINSYLIEENILNKTKQLDTEMIPEISVNGEISKKCQQSDNKNNHTIIEPLRVVAASISELEKNVKLTTETVENEQTTSKNENVHSQIAVVDLNSEVTNEEITHQKANNINKETSTSKVGIYLLIKKKLAHFFILISFNKNVNKFVIKSKMLVINY